MKKQILGCVAALLLSATIVTASTSHSVSTNVNGYSFAKDTMPSDSSHMKGKMHKMKKKSSMNDTSSTMNSGDSTKL